MNTQSSGKNDLYYTKDHEWIDFKGTVAYTGICSFKLIGFKEIQQVIFKEPLGFKKRGDLIATIKYNDYIIKAHMPVDGKVLEMNTNLIYGDDTCLLKFAEDTWIAKIAPSLPHERNDLLLPKHYQMNGKSKYAK
jgi:glycine cleavage system H protein